MDPSQTAPQRLTRLSPLSEAFAAIDAVARAVAPGDVAPLAAVGRVPAADVTAPGPLPPAALALRDGWAVRAELVADAGPYSPVPLGPPPTWVEVGDAMPVGADAVLPADSVATTAGRAEALSPVAPGEGVMAAGADARPGQVLAVAGRRLRGIDAAILRRAGIGRVSVRVPRVRIACAYGGREMGEDFVAPWIARAIDAMGGVVLAGTSRLAVALDDPEADAVVAVGGTGAGRRDDSVRALARAGTVAFHGVGLQPGETAAFGSAGGRPVLLLPGRLDAALAAMLVLGRHLLARLAGAGDVEAGAVVTLRRKVTSTVGISEVVLVRRAADGVEPIAANVFPLQALARADGYIVVPAHSEGHPPGATVEMRALP